MNRAVELHDSQVLEMRRDGVDLVLVLQAYVHQSLGEPGIAEGEGVSRVVEARFSHGVCVGTEPPWTISDGRLSCDGRRDDELVPLPYRANGPVLLVLDGPNDAHLTVQADRVCIDPVGPATFIERYSP